MMFKAVLFDMDGVIIDSEPIHKKVERKLFKELGLDISEEEHHSFVGTTSRFMWSAMVEKYKLDKTVDELVGLNSSAFLNSLRVQEDLKPMPGLVVLLEELRENGARIAVASSSPKLGIEAVLDVLQVGRYFDAAVSGHDVPNGKPEPDIFIHASQVLGVTPEVCIVIEDSTNGVRAAKAAGMKCVGLVNPNTGVQDLSMADIILNSLEELNYNILAQL